MDKLNENVIEFSDDQQFASVTASKRRLINRIKKLAHKFPDDVQILHTNNDGSVFAHVPTSWVKINPPRQISDEQRQRLSENARKNFGQEEI